MAVPTRPQPDVQVDPDGGMGGVHELLTKAVEEAARLLDADGAMVYLIDPATGNLRFAHDAGIESAQSRAWVRSLELAPGTGMFGRAVVERGVVVTDDYGADPSFRHAERTDRVVADLGIRSMVVAPLVAGDEVFGAIGTFSTRAAAFDRAQIALVRSLADHAAAAMANTRLIEDLDRSRTELAERAEIERTLRQINARISAAADLSSVLQLAVDEAARLLRADGARIDLIDAQSGLLRWAYASGAVKPDDDLWPNDPDETLDQGISGQAVVNARPFWTGDYGRDDRFPHGSGADSYVDAAGIRSVMAAPLVGEAGAFGALTTFTGRADAWAEPEAGLLEAIAAQAAIAIARTRLLEELDRSRAALARRAEAEQALREIAARITAMRDPAEILQQVVELASRLVGGQGAILDILDPESGHLRWAFDDGLRRLFTDDERAKLWISVGVGATGSAVAEDRVVVAGDDLASQFPPSPESTEFYERTGFRSMIAAPITGEGGPLGVIEVYTVIPDAFDEEDAALIRALAGQAAIAITNARLIGELERSREENAQRADAERTLREIAARVSSILDPATVLTQIVAESARLLASDGSRIDLWDERLGALRWAYSAGEAMAEVPEWGRTGGLKPRQAVAGLAFAEQRPVMTADYLADERFVTTPEIEAFVRKAGIRAVISAPLTGEGGDPLGVLSVVSRQPGAYSETEVELLTALATHASIAITNAHLMEELARSREDIERRAEAEASLRQIAARITALREPDEVLQHVIDEAQRLLRADGALIDQYDAETGTLQWAYDAGIPDEQREALRMANLRLGEGVSGKAVAEGQVVHVGDYLQGDFQHDEQVDSLVQAAGVRDLIVAPIIGDSGPLGAIEVMSRRAYAFDDFDAALLGSLAEQAAIAITNARLIEELKRSRMALERRAETERSLRDITARIAALTDPDKVLERVVEDAKRLLATDGAHLTRMGPTGTYLVPVVVTGAGDDAMRQWLMGKRFPLGGGINGLAAEQGEPVSTFDYMADERIPHGDDDDADARRLGLRGMAAAPLRAPGGEVMGTLAISTKEPRIFEADDLDLLQGLADQAAIALTNSNLLARMTESEERYRFLVQNAPDVVWSIGADARITFLSHAVERLTGFRPEELIGQHFGAIVHRSSREVAEIDWTTAMRAPSQEVRGRLNLQHRDGSAIPAEFIAVATLADDGTFAGANGSVRDMREQDRLERELRASEDRYRTLASSSPDMVFATDAEGRYTFLSDRAEAMLGWDLEASLGRSFTGFVAPGFENAAVASYQAVLADPTKVHSTRMDFLNGDGEPVQLEINVIGKVEDGKLVGINGVARDVSERERLERELKRSEERYRFLVQHSPDVVFSTDPEGNFTFISAAIERLTGYHPGQLIGQHFGTIVESEDTQVAGGRWETLTTDPGQEVQAAQVLRGRDGQRTPVDVRAVGVRIDGRFAGIQGAARDVSDQVRLERELRRQAGELAAGEERAHLARELHDSVTQALFSMTLVSRSVEMLLGTDPDAARAHLGQLRELQREALAEMRALIFELRPGNLQSDGLVRALKTHTAALQGRLGLPVVVESDLEARLPLAAEEVLYRIAQEALHNVVKHAAARQVRVDVRPVDGGVRLRVEDDGKGFEPDAVPDGHLGLAGMRARAERVGATFSCESQPGAGTVVEVAFGQEALAALQVAATAGDAASHVPAVRDTASIRDG